MNCDPVQLLLHGYLDGELDLVSSIDIETHLKTCPACYERYKELKRLKSVLASSTLSFEAPDSLQARIKTSIRASSDSPRVRLSSRPVLAGAAFVLLVLLVLLVGAWQGWFFGGQSARLAEEVQAAHVRSLMANHLTDVTSTDQHTVKPWFNGKLDFSPPVVNFATESFPLIGGRLDFLDGHPVAALVYQRNEHFINLFIWPTPGVTQPLQSSTYNGYHLFNWSQYDMTYWAVSDLEVTQLQDFVTLVQKNFR
jgi:anti-sigma factor RsiW